MRRWSKKKGFGCVDDIKFFMLFYLMSHSSCKSCRKKIWVFCHKAIQVKYIRKK